MIRLTRARLARVVQRIPALSAVGVAAVLLAAGLIVLANAPDHGQHNLVNVSYSATGEVYRVLNQSFADDYRQQTSTAVTVETSNGGSGRQARSVAEGSEHAAVVSLAL